MSNIHFTHNGILFDDAMLAAFLNNVKNGLGIAESAYTLGIPSQRISSFIQSNNSVQLQCRQAIALGSAEMTVAISDAVKQGNAGDAKVFKIMQSNFITNIHYWNELQIEDVREPIYIEDDYIEYIDNDKMIEWITVYKRHKELAMAMGLIYPEYISFVSQMVIFKVHTKKMGLIL